MCLNLNIRYHKVIAKRDKTVYKCLIKEGSVLKTSYRNYIVKIGYTYESKIKINHVFNVIDIGIHSFVNLCTAKYYALRYNELVVKCIIPKGATYYVGKFYEHNSIVSDKLKYIEIVKDFSSKYLK